jgi:hypothetical protein
VHWRKNSQWKGNSQWLHNLATTRLRRWKLLDTDVPCETWACSRQRRQGAELGASCKFAMRAVPWCTRAPSTGCSGRTSPWMTRRAPPHCQLMRTRDALQRTPAASPSLLPKHFKIACQRLWNRGLLRLRCSVARHSHYCLGSLSSMRWSSCEAPWLSDNVGMDERRWVASNHFHPPELSGWFIDFWFVYLFGIFFLHFWSVQAYEFLAIHLYHWKLVLCNWEIYKSSIMIDLLLSSTWDDA